MELIEKLNWRYATKRMTGAKIPHEKLNRILEAVRFAPSSMGLQPYRVFVISDQETRKKLAPAAYNQPQITESSELIVFAAWDNIKPAQIQEYIDRIATERGIAAESLDGFKASMMGASTNKTQEELYQWNARQAYIALGIGLVAAAEEQVDATPMEGFNPVAFDEILGLQEKGLRSVCIMALGYRDEATDVLAKAKKVRTHAKDLFIHI
jgi:nitroreductase/dihydropteridine reductase